MTADQIAAIHQLEELLVAIRAGHLTACRFEWEEGVGMRTTVTPREPLKYVSVSVTLVDPKDP